MNNIITLNTKHEQYRPLAFSPLSDLYFDVWERPTFFQGKDIGNYYADTEHKHIVRMWKGNPTAIGLVGKNYKLLKNQELCEGIEQTFMDTMTKEELDGVYQTRSCIIHGRYIYQRLHLPKYHQRYRIKQE
jgi:hypothetical protein